MRNAIAKCVFDTAKENVDFFLITGDAGLGVWDQYREEFPNQYINPGINEALCVGMSAGLALEGYRAVYYNIVPFVIMRPYEQVRNDICYQELPVILVGIGSGLTYMPGGMTHYSVEDIGIALSMPNLQIFSPCDPIEAKKCFEYAYQSDKPSYIRIPKSGEPIIHSGDIGNIENFQVLRESKQSILLVTHSAMISEVLKSAEILDAGVISVPFINSPMREIFVYMKKFEKVYIIEEHFEYGGLATYLQDRTDQRLERIGLPNHYIHIIGNQKYGREYYGLDSDGIIKKIRKDI